MLGIKAKSASLASTRWLQPVCQVDIAPEEVTVVTKATRNASCLADFSDTDVAFAGLPQIPPRNVNWFIHGKWVHLAKIAFEKYCMRKMKNCTSKPIYE